MKCFSRFLQQMFFKCLAFSVRFFPDDFGFKYASIHFSPYNMEMIREWVWKNKRDYCMPVLNTDRISLRQNFQSLLLSQ